MMARPTAAGRYSPCLLYTSFVAYQYAASAVIINTISTQAPLLPIIKLAVGPVIVYLWIFKVLGANIMRLVVKKEAEGGAV